jgi:Tol biopolymer transport system component
LLWAPEAGEHLAAAGFSDNGSLIFSASMTDGKTAHWRVYSLAVASGTPEILFDGADARIVSGNRSAQRNAGRLCYSKPAGGIHDIWCSDLEGRGEKELTKHDGKEDLVSPTISPDGAWVAFEVDGDKDPISNKPSGSTVWKIGLNGAGIQQLTRGGDDTHPSWSDDGKKIYFQRRMPDGNQDIYSMEADGTDPAPILRTVDVDEMFPVRRAATDDFLLSEVSASGTPRLKMLDADTKAGRYLTAGLGPETWPSVSPDGKIASFLAPPDPTKPDVLGIWLIQLQD